MIIYGYTVALVLEVYKWSPHLQAFFTAHKAGKIE
jgi:hypothetical protein